MNILIVQHRRGRELTRRILEVTAAAAHGKRARRTLAADMAAFIRMYEPHEAREDTVIFPALREVVSAREWAELGETFEKEEHRRFGADGFTRFVHAVADIEKSLGIHDLAEFTP